MAFEQFRAWVGGRSQEELGPVTTVGPDGFPLLQSSELRAEHDQISAYLESLEFSGSKKASPNRYEVFLGGGDGQRTGCYLAMLERMAAMDAGLSRNAAGGLSRFFTQGIGFEILSRLLDEGVDMDRVLVPTLMWLSQGRRFDQPEFLQKVLELTESCYGRPAPGKVTGWLVELQSRLAAQRRDKTGKTLIRQIDRLLLGEDPIPIVAGELWADAALSDLESAAERSGWQRLLLHCQDATSTTPTKKWLQSGETLLNEIGADAFLHKVLPWLVLIEKDHDTIDPLNAETLRGLIWLCLLTPNADVCRTLTQVALTCYRKIPGIGPRAVKVGNAAVYVLGEIGTADALAHLAVLKAKVKVAAAQKGIEKAFAQTSKRLDISPDDLEEIAVPNYGLTEVGMLRRQVGDFTAELRVVGSKTDLAWIKPDGKRQKSLPAAVRVHFSEVANELKQTAKDIDRMLSAQGTRIDQLYLHPRTWKYPVWSRRYLEHTLLGSLARRLIWKVTKDGQSASVACLGDQLVDASDRPVAWIDEETVVSLWHPLDEPPAVIAAWRDWLSRHEISQPFKQAHREIYLLTDAECATRTYSNRFAGHILRQHQFHALCGVRGWKNQLRMLVQSVYPATHLELPDWGLRAEFWVEEVHVPDGSAMNEAGAYLYVSTDQVRFYSIDTEVARTTRRRRRFGVEAEQPLPLTEIPPLVFSEVMRDVDLFVGVASVGNDPTWNDGGPDGRYEAYWNTYSFGELTAPAVTRKEVLQRMIPRLRIADRCSFDHRFLIVRGDLRTYKIHLGSSNILMEPDDSYLCIVPAQSAKSSEEPVFLPFEGDSMLSIILSKAMLLANDTTITDPTILNQIHARKA